MQRKPRHILKQNWTRLRSNIEKVRKELKLNAKSFSEVNQRKWEGIEQKIAKQFLYERRSGLRSTWLWEDIDTEIAVITCERDPYAKLPLFIPKNELLYFFVNETVNERTKYWYYEGNIQAVVQVIAHTTGTDEYYLVSKKYDWLLCVNHHYVLIASGSIIPKVTRYKSILKG